MNEECETRQVEQTKKQSGDEFESAEARSGVEPVQPERSVVRVVALWRALGFVIFPSDRTLSSACALSTTSLCLRPN
jgi:hypothetical protein